MVLGDDFQVITRGADEGLGDEIFVDGFGESPASTNLLSSIPTALTRWGEESQILDQESVHWCVTALKPFIFPVLEKHQATEIAKEKEEAAKKKKETEKKNASKASEEKKKEEKNSQEKEAEQKGENNVGENSQSATSAMQAEQEVTVQSPESEPSSSSTRDAGEAAVLPPAREETAEMSSDESSASILIAMHMEEPAQLSSEVRTSTPVDSDITPAANAVAERITLAATSEAVANHDAASTTGQNAINMPDTPGSTTQVTATSPEEVQGAGSTQG